VLQICEHEPARAKDLQSQVRDEFQRFFAEGLAVTGFELDEQNGNYLLQPV
jgi:predicted GNAT superfamily acetyltransferase